MSDIQELKDLLEDTARTTNLKVEGELAVLQTPEQRESNRQFEEWKAECHDVTEVSEFALPNELIKCVLKTDQYNGLIFQGEGGIGKTITALSAIKRMLAPSEWDYSNGYTTPLALYEFLYENRNRKVIILDDVEGIFNNNLSLSILKGALWDSDGQRIVQYSSKSDKATMPQKFLMKAKIIILCNHIPKENDISTRAMMSRTIEYDLKFTFEQKMAICEKFVTSDDALSLDNKRDILRLLKKNVTEATMDFNFRTLRKLTAFVQYDREKAESLFSATTHVDEDREAYLFAVGATNQVKAQITIFMERTGKSRRTFFNVKRLFSAKVQPISDIALALHADGGN